MAVPATGIIGIMTCPQGACSGVGFIVCGGSVSGPQSLKNLATQAGISSAYLGNFHGTTIGDLAVCPSSHVSIPSAGATCCTYSWSVCPNTTCVQTTCSWLHPATSTIAPNPAFPGTPLGVTIDANVGAARCGTVTYTPIHCGSVQTVTFCQLAGITWKCVNLGTCTTVGCGTARIACQFATNIISTPLSAGECYCVCVAYNGGCSAVGGCAVLLVIANGTPLLNCLVTTTCVSSSLSFTICPAQTFTLCAIACKPVVAGVPHGYVGISSITSIVGNECLGSGGCFVCAVTCSPP